MYKSGEVVKIVNKELGGKITREAGPLPGIGTKIVAFLDPDSWKTVSNPFKNISADFFASESLMIVVWSIYNETSLAIWYRRFFLTSLGNLEMKIQFSVLLNRSR